MFSSVLKLQRTSAAARSVAARMATRGFAKEIKFGTDGREAMLQGVNVLADAVQVGEVAEEKRTEVQTRCIPANRSSPYLCQDSLGKRSCRHFSHFNITALFSPIVDFFIRLIHRSL